MRARALMPHDLVGAVADHLGLLHAGVAERVANHQQAVPGEALYHDAGELAHRGAARQLPNEGRRATVGVATELFGKVLAVVAGDDRRQRRRPSGDGITLSRLRLLIWVPVQSSPCMPVEGPRYQMSGPEVVGVTDGDALIEGRADVGLGVGATGCPAPVRNDQRTLICLCSPLPVQSSWSSSTW